MKDLDPGWFSTPLTGKGLFNIALKTAHLRLLRFEGSYCVIRSIHEQLPLEERDKADLCHLIQQFVDAGIELGNLLREHNDFKLV